MNILRNNKSRSQQKPFKLMKLYSIPSFTHSPIFILKIALIWLLVKPGTPEHGTPEQHHSGTQNTGTLKILNLLKIQKILRGGG
jgi:hypothetical protein